MTLVRLLHMLRFLMFGMAFACIPAVVTAQNTVAPVQPAAMIKTYCASCHSGRAPSGRLSLDGLDANRPSAAAEIWERVVRHLRARTMPPMAAPRPDSKT